MFIYIYIYIYVYTMGKHINNYYKKTTGSLIEM